MSGRWGFSLRNLHDYFWGFKLTPGGRMLVLGVVVTAIGSVTVEIPIYQTFCALLGVLTIAEPLGLLFRPVVELHGALPETARAGEPFTTAITVTNRSRKPVYDLALGLFGLPPEVMRHHRDDYLPVLRRGDSISFPLTLEARRRGFYRLPAVHAHSTFPFHLMRFGSCKLAEQSLTVLPAYHAIDHVELPLTQRYQPGGTLLTAQLGNSVEYVGNREYTPGEPIRRLDARAWARLGRPIVREYQDEYSCRVALILDTHVPLPRIAGPEGHADLEAAISLAAAVAEFLSAGDYLIDLFAAGPDLHVFRTGRSRANLDRVLEILACVDASRTDPLGDLSAAVADELESISTAVCVFLNWDKQHQLLIDHLLEAGCAVKVVVVRDEPTTQSLNSAQVDIMQYSSADISCGAVHVL